jgi:radical SAM-linked protein
MRLRITFTKSGALRYTGHLDLQTVWERTVRRAGLPLKYTQGFHPGPRIQIAAALPLGFIGQAEIVDIWLHETGGETLETGGAVGMDLLPARNALQKAAPPGLTIISVEQVDEAGPALQTQVDSAEYVVRLLDPVDEPGLSERLAAMLQAQSLSRQRRGKDYDLRPLIEEIAILPANGAEQSEEPPRIRISMRLAARPGATGRPEEVLDELGIPLDAVRITRTRLILRSGVE